MSEYSLSVVQLCPDAYKDAANAIAEAYGYGSGNLSVELRSSVDNSVWWGCHAWWIPEALQLALSPPEEIAPILANVITSYRELGTNPANEAAYNHWIEVLEANKLQRYSDEVI